MNSTPIRNNINMSGYTYEELVNYMIYLYPKTNDIYQYDIKNHN